MTTSDKTCHALGVLIGLVLWVLYWRTIGPALVP